MSYNNSLVLFVPAAKRDAAIELGRALGFEAGFTVALSPSGQAPATHYGLHTWARDEFLALLQGPTPSVEGWSAAQVDAVRSAFTASVQQGGEGGAHFTQACASAGLAVIEDQ